MGIFASRPSPLHILEDSGVLPGSTDYTTVVILHGYSYHSGIFTKLVPLGRAYNTRVLLVNRRDYPGSAPYTQAELTLLTGQSSTTAAKENVHRFMKAQARELYELLEGLVKRGEVPKADRRNNKGGIVVAGWSMGAVWMTALLAHAPSFTTRGVNMADYMLRVVFFDAPFRILGYPCPEKGVYNPLFDEELPLEEREGVFADWVSGYFPHGLTLETLAPRTYLEEPPPTLSTLTSEDVARTLCHAPGEPGGSDALLLHAGIEHGLWAALRKAALGLPESKSDVPHAEAGGGGAWREVEVRNVTCERSICDTLFAGMRLREEVKDAQAEGLPVRDVRFVLIKGANHFVQWDQPEYALRALVGDEDVVE